MAKSLLSNHSRYFGMTHKQIVSLGILAVLNLCLLSGGVYYVLHSQQSTQAYFPSEAGALDFKSGQQDWQSIPSTDLLPVTPSITPPPILTATPSPSPSLTLTPTPTNTPTVTSSPSPTPTATPTNYSIIGHSIQGRPLEVYRFGEGLVERMIVAGIHGGNEYNTIQLADLLIRYLSAHPETIPDNDTLHILRSLNPDGAARAHNMYGRANDHGVDLNHNWPVNWEKDWDRDGCWRYLYLNGGVSPASEPETIALMNFILTHHVDALISYHSAALGIFPGGEPPDPDSVSLAEAVAKVSYYPYPAIETGCEYTGSLPDWAVSKGIAALDVELTNHKDTDFIQNLAILSVFLNWKR